MADEEEEFQLDEEFKPYFDDELPEWMTEVCEHGLSAWLCSGPNHYSDEF